MIDKDKAQLVSLIELRPNNWFINRAKLERVREAWQREEQEALPPVLVTEIDSELSLIDGHSRVYAAFERGETHIRAFVSDLEQIEGSKELYRHIHREGAKIGIETIADLKDRIVEPGEHERLWIGYCTTWLEENERAARENTMKSRCEWCGSDPLYVAYHDDEWGVPIHDDQRLFEMLILEGAQAGLSWLTILKKREGYREAFHAFEVEKIASYSQRDIDRLLANPGIVRNRLKIESTIKNARGVLGIREEFGTLDLFLWRYVDGVPRQNAWTSMAEVPAKTEQSEAMSKDLKKRGFNFVGSTICYAFMQAVGMVNDHTTDCYRCKEIAEAAR